MKAKKGAIEISFGWIFAIIAGIVILFLAIYLSSRIISTGQKTVTAETGQQIGILLDPLETSFESAQTTSITIPVDTRIHNTCDTFGYFGQQSIQLEQISFGKWTQTDTSIFFENKYIFSNAQVEGTNFYIFSKPLYFPFKIADLVYMTSSNDVYCFVNAPSDIENEISQLNEQNLLVTNDSNNCSEGDIKVCFGNDPCDVNVNYDQGYVQKNNSIVYFSGTGTDYTALMYAAIFSDKDVYECQLKRLMMREGEISLLYKNKETLVTRVNCDNNLGSDLATLNGLAGMLNSSADLSSIKMEADIINDKNTARRCQLW